MGVSSQFPVRVIGLRATVPRGNPTVITRRPLDSAEKGMDMDEMFTVSVKWPDGREITGPACSREAATALADFLWKAGADDVKITCECGWCETCTDRAAFEGI